MTNTEAYTLCRFTGIFIENARADARHGNKDSARNWARFFKNSGIVGILEKYAKNSDGLPIDVLQLKNDLWKLDDECHPQSHSDDAIDHAASKVQMDTVAFGIGRILELLESKKRRRK